MTQRNVPFPSRVVFMSALAFAGFEAALCYMSMAFAGFPTDPGQIAWLLIGLLLFIPAAASWWHPKIGLWIYLAGLGSALCICLLRFAFTHTDGAWGYCLGVFEPALIGGALLVVHAMLTRRRKNALNELSIRGYSDGGTLPSDATRTPLARRRKYD